MEKTKKITFSQAAVMNIHYLFYPLEHFFATMKKLGVLNIDLWAGYPHFFIDDDFRRKTKEILNLSRQSGTKIICFTPEQVRYPINLAAIDKNTHDRTMTYLLNGLDSAAELESKMFQVVPGWGYYDQAVEPAWVSMCESLRKLCERAEVLGIEIILEPLQIIESNLVGDVKSAKRALLDVGSDQLKIVVDTCHMAVNGETLEQYFEELGDQLGHIHLNESNQVPWGEGELPLQHYLNVMEQFGYEKYFTLEICSLPHHVDADQSVSNNVKYVKKCLEN